MVTSVFPPRYAGGVIQAIHLSKELKKQGIDVEFVTDNFETTSISDTFEGIPVHRLKTFRETKGISRKFRELLYVIKVFGLIRAKGYDVVFLHSVPALTIFLFPWVKWIGKKTVLELTLVDSDDPATLKKRRLGPIFHRCLLSATKIVAISSRLHELSLEAGIPLRNLALIPVGVDTSKFYPSSQEEKEKWKRELGYADKEIIFIAVGQVEDRKGYEFMLNAWKIIQERLPNAALLIAGPKNTPENPYFVKLSLLREKLALRNVKFLGMVTNVNDYMKTADCLLHCGANEGLPNTLVEASVSSVPIVCLYIEGVTSDIIFDPVIGKECKSASAADFAEMAISFVT